MNKVIQHEKLVKMDTDGLILVTGANGYVGGSLVPRLLEQGYRVRCLVRNPASIQSRAWSLQAEILQGDILDVNALEKALQGVSKAYYLIHNMSNGRGYPERDRTAANNFGVIAGAAGVKQIIYLGGLADPDTIISQHMRSRLETGDHLREGGVPVTEFRSSLVIGSGSISFEMIRYLTEQFPILLGPRWVQNFTQPISIKNVLDYLLAALDLSENPNQVFEIGGRDRITYADTMLIYARMRGLKRRLLVSPFAPLGILATLVDILTPVPKSIARPLLEGMCSDSVVRDEKARLRFPQIQPNDYRSAISESLSKLYPSQIEPVWRNPTISVKIIKYAGFFIDYRQIYLDVQPIAAFHAFTRLGGKYGWIYLNWLWQLRGWVDRLFGGPGMRGRQEEELLEGQVVDFYRVEALEPGQLLRLRAELKAPGDGWMEWRVSPKTQGGSLLEQVAFFAPKGTLGFFYWYFLLPIHRLVFTGLLKRIARRASQIQQCY